MLNYIQMKIYYYFCAARRKTWEQKNRQTITLIRIWTRNQVEKMKWILLEEWCAKDVRIYVRHMLGIHIVSIQFISFRFCDFIFWAALENTHNKKESARCKLFAVAWILCNAKGNQVTCWTMKLKQKGRWEETHIVYGDFVSTQLNVFVQSCPCNRRM